MRALHPSSPAPGPEGDPVPGSGLLPPLEPPLVGRAGALRALVDAARGGAAALLVAGPRGAGATRLAREAAREIAGSRGTVVDAESGHADPARRMARALRRAGAGRSADVPAGPVVVLLGDVDPAHEVPRPPVPLRRLSRLTLIATSRRPREDLPSAVVGALEEDDARTLAAAVAPELGEEAAARVLEVSGRLPGRIVALARAASTWRGEHAPLPIPDDLLREALSRLEGLPPGAVETARWAAVADEPLVARALVRLTGHAEAWVERAFDALVAAGVLEEVPPPGPPRWRFGDRLVREALLADLLPSDLRRRHAAALAAGRAAGRPLDVLVRHAAGAARPDDVTRLSLAAARAARSAGDASGALRHAERAAQWARWASEARLALEAQGERGNALLDLGEFLQAAEILEGAAEGLRAAGDEEAAVMALCDASNARWHAGDHEAALRLITERALLQSEPAGRSMARALALTQAAGFGNMLARFAEAERLGVRAREACLLAGAREDGARAFIFLGMARAGRGLAHGLDDIARARAEARRGGGTRNETLALIYESHVLLALGRPHAAVDAARAGIARARELRIGDHELVLRMNLGDALVAIGDLRGAQQEIDRAAEGWRRLRHDSPLPSDPSAAWLLLARGEIDAALPTFHALSGFARLDRMPFEHVASVMAGHALAAAAAGAAVEAEAVVAAGLAAWRGTDDRLLAVPLLAAGADVGGAREAEACANALSGIARAAGPAGLASAFLRLAVGRAAARAGEAAAAADSCLAAAGLLDALGMGWWAARAWMLAGLAGGEGDAAAEALLEARRRFENMGADGWRLRCEAALRALGRRVPSRGAAVVRGDLTTREMEVLLTLAEGLTNREIGERLYISERTVARHLIQVFAKLGVTTRTAAVGAAREAGLLDAAVPAPASRRGRVREQASGGVVLLGAPAAGRQETAAGTGRRRGGRGRR
jgi:DNA-binding CsgD family transcriptional regulator